MVARASPLTSAPVARASAWVRPPAGSCASLLAKTAILPVPRRLATALVRPLYQKRVFVGRGSFRDFLKCRHRLDTDPVGRGEVVLPNPGPLEPSIILALR